MELVVTGTLAALVFGGALLVVLLTSLLKNPWFSEKTKVAIATVLSVLVAGVAAWFGLGGAVNPANVFVLITSIYGTSNLVYKWILEGGRVDKALENTVVVPTNSDDT
jgi:hypothetical protein